MTRIGTLAYKLAFDATDLTRGMMSSKQAFAAHKKIVQESQSPQDKYAQGLANLQVLVARHPDMLQHQTRLQGDLQREYLKQEQAVRQLTDSEAKRLHTLTAGERAAESAARAEARLSRARKDAKGIIDANRTANDTYSRAVAHHNSLLRKGLIDYGTYSRAVGKLRQEYMSTLPIIGRFSGMLANPGAAAGVVALAGFAIAVRNVAKEMQYLDEVAKNAARLDMDPRAFLVLSKAANHAGVEASRLFDAMGKLQVRMGQAGLESETAMVAFQRIGIDFQRLQQLSPEDAFLRVGEALRSVKDNTERLALANDIFGKGSRDLMTLLGMSRAEYDALQRSMQLRGELFTAAELARVEQVNDAIGDLHASWRALWQNAAVDMAPAIKQLVFVGEQLMIVNKIANAINFHKADKLVEGAIAARDSGLGGAANFALGGTSGLPGDIMKMMGVPKFLDQYDQHVLNPKQAASLDPALPAAAAGPTEQQKLEHSKLRLEAEQRVKDQAAAALEIEKRRSDEILRRQREEMRQRSKMLSIQQRMQNLSPDKQMRVGQQFMQETMQRRMIEQQEERQRMAQGSKEAASKPASMVTANSQEAYRILTQSMQQQNKGADMKQKQALEESKKQTKLLEKVINAIEDVDVMGSM